MDIQYFVNCIILLKDRIYKFFDHSDRPFYCRLPQEGLTLLTRADIEFLPETVQLCDVPP